MVGIDADGITVNVDTPVNGMTNLMMKPEELNGAAEEINGEAVGRSVDSTNDSQKENGNVDNESVPKPSGVGVFGNIYTQFKGKVKEAVDFLKRMKSGEAMDVISHKDIGGISLVWGNENYGLAHILAKHPNVLDGLQERINEMSVVSNTANRIVLESATHRAVVSKMLGEEKTPQWLLTAYEKKNATGGSSDIVPEPQGGMQNGTASLQSNSSSANIGNNSESGINNTENNSQSAELEGNKQETEGSRPTALERIPKDEQGNPIYEQTDAGTAWDAIVEQAEGDETMAQTVANGMVADKQAALSKAEEAKSKGGKTVAEKIAAEKERAAAISKAKAELEHWQEIASTVNRRKAEAEEAQRKAAEELAARRKAEEERQRAEKEEAVDKEQPEIKENIDKITKLTNTLPDDFKGKKQILSGLKMINEANSDVGVLN